MPDQLRGFDIEEDNDDAAERLQRRPRVYRGMLIYQASNGLEVIRLEDGGDVEIRDQKGVRRRRRCDERREV